MKITAMGIGPNTGLPMHVQVGTQTGTFVPQLHMESFSRPFALDATQDSIKFTVPAPISPSQIGLSADQRPLGIDHDQRVVSSLRPAGDDPAPKCGKM